MTQEAALQIQKALQDRIGDDVDVVVFTDPVEIRQYGSVDPIIKAVYQLIHKIEIMIDVLAEDSEPEDLRKSGLTLDDVSEAVGSDPGTDRGYL